MEINEASHSCLHFIALLNQSDRIQLLVLLHVAENNHDNGKSKSTQPYSSPVTDGDEAVSLERSLAAFCEAQGISYQSIKVQEPELKTTLEKTTRYADLLVVASNAILTTKMWGDPAEYLHSLLQLSECPAIVIPGNYSDVENIVFAFDGSASAMFAIKQFSYLLSGFSRLDVIAVIVKSRLTNNESIEPSVLKFLEQHFIGASVGLLKFQDKENLISWMNGLKKSIVVGGAFGRSSFSQLIRKSFVANIISDQQLAVFVAHM